MRNFAVFALPRSRSSWLGAFLTWKDWTCYHEPTIGLKRVEDLDLLLHRPRIGVVDTAWALLWPEVIDRDPGLRIVTLERPRAEIIESTRRVLACDEALVNAQLDRLDLALSEIKKLSGVLSIQAKSLDSLEGVKKVFEFCLPYKLDPDWYNHLRSINIQPDLKVMLARGRANAQGIFNTYGPTMRAYANRLGQS